MATADEAFSTSLSLSNGGITLQNAAVAVAALDPSKAFGASAAGPLQFRIVASGIAGDWQPLATLVRLPQLKDLKCPATPELACKLSGVNLFLLDSVAMIRRSSTRCRCRMDFRAPRCPCRIRASGSSTSSCATTPRSSIPLPWTRSSCQRRRRNRRALRPAMPRRMPPSRRRPAPPIRRPHRSRRQQRQHRHRCRRRSRLHRRRPPISDNAARARLPERASAPASAAGRQPQVPQNVCSTRSAGSGGSA